MNIPEKEFSKAEFRQYLTDHSNYVFKEDKRKKWLKIYCLLVSDDSWQTTLFKPEEVTRLGEVFKVKPKTDLSSKHKEVYFIEEYAPGLLILYTTANNYKYQKDLGNRIRRTRGVSQMWIRPDMFRVFWKGILSDTGGYVYRFTSRRKRGFDDTPCQKRPDYKRRFNYTGDDATQTLEELEGMYGVTPESLYLQATRDLKIHITNDGLFSAQEASALALNLFFKQLDAIKDDVLEIRNTSKLLQFKIVNGQSNLKSASIVAGVITFNQEIDAVITEKLCEELKNFSFIDTHLESGSLSFTATVIDELKGSVFDISATESQILLVPKYRETFESFIDFYRGVVESVDEHAKMSLLN